MTWRAGGRVFGPGDRGLVMGVLNVTPDSFSDGGRWLDVAAAVARGVEMVEEGAVLVDVGGESTRPGAAAVVAEEEARRVVPVVDGLRRALGERVLISVDTSKAEVAAAALEVGAGVVNDVTGLEGDAGMMRVVAGSDCGVVLMHMQGTPRTMQSAPAYGDVVAEVGDYLAARVAACGAAGIDPERLLGDPGIGFGKGLEHNLALLRGLREVGRRAGRPLLVGVSRKSFIGAVVGGGTAEDRDWPTVGLTAFSRQQGAAVVRVHEVRGNVEAMRMVEAVLKS